VLPSGIVVLISVALSHKVVDKVLVRVLNGVKDATGVRLGNGVRVGRKVLVNEGVGLIPWVFKVVGITLTVVSVGGKAVVVF
jgi:hypothetical protein